MSDKPKISRREARLQRVAALRELIDLLAEIEREDGVPEPIDLVLPKNEHPDREAYAKLPLTEAIPLYLKTCKEPQTAREIWLALRSAGREMITQNPVRAVKQALKELLVTNNDLFHVGWARWHLKSQCSPSVLKKMKGIPQNGTGGRPLSEHISRTKKGMETARASGKRLGAEKRIDDAMKISIQQMAALKKPEKKTLSEIAKAHGIGMSSIFYAFPGGRNAILAWKPDAPPEVKPPELRVVK